jgi:iron complex transport system substrate-binding protein
MFTGRAIGKAPAAERLRVKAQAQLSAVAKAHPEFEGQTAVFATPYQGIYVYGPQDSRSRLLTQFGFSFPSSLASIGGKSFGGQVSDEKVDLLDLGAIVWFASPSAAKKIKSQPVYRDLDVRKEARDVFLGDQGALYEATSFISVLSIPLLVDKLVPKIAAAADGDPATNA